MLVPDQTECLNRLLSLMSADDFELLAPALEFIEAGRGFVIAEPNQAIEHVVFSEGAIVSIVSRGPEGHGIEAGLFGTCGFGPTAAILGSDRTLQQHVVQVAGGCYRLPLAAFVSATEESATLRKLLLRFVHVLLVQTAQTALSNAIHQVDRRLARWILMCHDRSASDELALTHESIALMLAIRRPSVTTSLHVLEGERLIRNDRGRIVIRNRPALADFAGDSYGVPEAEFERLIGRLSPQTGVQPTYERRHTSVTSPPSRSPFSSGFS